MWRFVELASPAQKYDLQHFSEFLASFKLNCYFLHKNLEQYCLKTVVHLFEPVLQQQGFLLIVFFWFTYLKDRIRGRGRELSSSGWWSPWLGLDWMQATWVAGSSWSAICCRGPSTPLLFQTISRELSQKWDNQDLNQCLCGTAETFTHCTIMPSPGVLFYKQLGFPLLPLPN